MLMSVWVRVCVQLHDGERTHRRPCYHRPTAVVVAAAAALITPTSLCDGLPSTLNYVRSHSDHRLADSLAHRHYVRSHSDHRIASLCDGLPSTLRIAAASATSTVPVPAAVAGRHGVLQHHVHHT